MRVGTVHGCMYVRLIVPMAVTTSENSSTRINISTRAKSIRALVSNQPGGIKHDSLESVLNTEQKIQAVYPVQKCLRDCEKHISAEDC